MIQTDIHSSRYPIMKPLPKNHPQIFNTLFNGSFDDNEIHQFWRANRRECWRDNFGLRDAARYYTKRLI